MSRQLKTHGPYLHLLRTTTPKQRKALLKTITNQQLDAVCACAQNILRGNVPLSHSKKAYLAKHKKSIRKLVSRNLSRRAKQQLLNQRGGFLGGLLGAVVPILGKVLGL